MSRQEDLTNTSNRVPYCALFGLRLPVSDLCPAAYGEGKSDSTGRDDTEHGYCYLVPGHRDSVRRVAFRATRDLK